jgi:hypothetical protein
MILEERNEFCDATALNTGAPGSYLIGDVIDTGGDGADGNSDDLYAVVQIDTAVTSGAAASVSFALCSDAQAAIAVDGTQTTHYVSAEIPKATLVAGYTAVAVELPRGIYERYLGIVQKTVTTALTAGKVNAFLTNDPNVWKAFPKAANS